MGTRFGRSETIGESTRSAHGQDDGAQTRRYASFVVRTGATGALVIAHDQSGDRVQTDSLSEAIGWIRSRTQPHPVRVPAAPHDKVIPGRGESASDRILSARESELPLRIDATVSTPEEEVAA